MHFSRERRGTSGLRRPKPRNLSHCRAQRHATGRCLVRWLRAAAPTHARRGERFLPRCAVAWQERIERQLERCGRSPDERRTYTNMLKDRTGTQLEAAYNFLHELLGTRVMFMRCGEAENGDAAEAENGDEAKNGDAASSLAFSAFVSLMSVFFMSLMSVFFMCLPSLLPACFMAVLAAAAFVFVVAFAFALPLLRLLDVGIVERSGDGGSPSHDKRAYTHAAARHHTCGATAACRAQPLRP